MRLTIVGGGGFRVPLVYGALARARDRVGITEVVLTDTDSGRSRTMHRVLEGMGLDLPVRVIPDLDEALSGSAVVFAAIRSGGTRGRIGDERVALARGLLGQETIGPGGLAYAIRTQGLMEELAQRVARLAPEAWIINFTNPAGLITEAMLDHHPRVVGICDTPIGLVRRVARTLQVDLETAEIGYIGINHLGWLRSFTVDGVDLLPGLLADPDLLGQIEEARILGVEWVQRLGALPGEYLYYYYFTREAISSITSAGATRGEFLDRQQTRFYQEAARRPGSATDLWRETLAQRESTYMAEARRSEREEQDMGGGYHEVAVDLMAGLLAGERRRMILNVPNTGEIEALPTGAVIEVPCEVDGRGIRPIRPAAALDLDELGLLLSVKAADRALIEAVRQGSRSAAWRAFGVHPLVDSVTLARELVDDYMTNDPLIAAALPNP